MSTTRETLLSVFGEYDESKQCEPQEAYEGIMQHDQTLLARLDPPCKFVSFKFGTDVTELCSSQFTYHTEADHRIGT